MSLKLNHVVPFGRSFDEWQKMFDLTEYDLSKRFLGVGDAPASFNAEMDLGAPLFNTSLVNNFVENFLETVLLSKNGQAKKMLGGMCFLGRPHVWVSG